VATVLSGTSKAHSLPTLPCNFHPQPCVLSPQRQGPGKSLFIVFAMAHWVCSLRLPQGDLDFRVAGHSHWNCRLRAQIPDCAWLLGVLRKIRLIPSPISVYVSPQNMGNFARALKTLLCVDCIRIVDSAEEAHFACVCLDDASQIGGALVTTLDDFGHILYWTRAAYSSIRYALARGRQCRRKCHPAPSRLAASVRR